MAQTCRMCDSATEILKCGYGWPCYDGLVVCDDHKPHETPLLVDELAAAGRDLVRELSDWLIDEARPVWGHTNAGCVVTKRDRLNVVLARYQEEVGDGEVS